MIKLIKEYYEDITNLNQPLKEVDYLPTIQE